MESETPDWCGFNVIGPLFRLFVAMLAELVFKYNHVSLNRAPHFQQTLKETVTNLSGHYLILFWFGTTCLWSSVFCAIRGTGLWKGLRWTAKASPRSCPDSRTSPPWAWWPGSPPSLRRPGRSAGRALCSHRSGACCARLTPLRARWGTSLTHTADQSHMLLLFDWVNCRSLCTACEGR